MILINIKQQKQKKQHLITTTVAKSERMNFMTSYRKKTKHKISFLSQKKTTKKKTT